MKRAAALWVALACSVGLFGCSVSRPVATAYPFAVYSSSVVCPPDSISGKLTNTPGRIVLAAVDTFGDELPGTEVTVSLAGVEAEYISDDHGRLIIQDLPSGKYQFLVRLPGFQEAVVENAPVRRGCVTALVVPLQVIDLAH